MIANLTALPTFISVYWLEIFYFIPMMLALLYHVCLFVAEYSKEYRARRDYMSYIPRLTVGNVVSWFFWSLIPFANIIMVIFEVLPKLFGGFFKWWDAFQSTPLVPARPRPIPPTKEK